jgi:ABC-2 type transport system permease protein
MSISFYKSDQRKTLLAFGIIAAILILLNVISTFWHSKIDLTSDHRFTLSKATKNELANIKQPVSVRVLMTGSLPSNYKKLLQGTTDVLNAFKENSKGKIQFTFENPIESKSNEEKQRIGEQLAKIGITPMPLTSEVEEGEAVEKRYIFPYAIVNANGKESSVCLLENHYGMDMDGILNYSESMMEYKLINCIKQSYQAEKKQIAYVMGNGQLLNYNTLDALYTLGETYHLDTIDINQGIEIPPVYSCIIICRPTVPFDEKIKFKLDQYVMNGGRILWYVDAVNCSLDTMQNAPTYTAIPFDLNLDDLFLKYGARFNSNLVEDLQCNGLPLTVGKIGNKPDIREEPWIYFPILAPIANHPIVKNLDAISSRFAGTIDTIPNSDNVKHILLNTSQQSRSLNAPTTVSFNSVRVKPKTSLYNKKNMPIAISIEGNFSSLYENRMDPGFMKIYQDSLGKQFKAKTDKSNKMILVADADMMLNDFSAKRGPSELGFYSPTGKLFANKTFLLNCVEYLTDDNHLLEARGKDVQLRLLDKERVKKNKSVMQFLNIALPIALVAFAGGLYLFMRRKKYEQPANTSK